ncbi:hypothetical protein T492DRAFT_1025538 [Pavlovales sp. CCMP2436]|nr:hypothetical protein T492DRAFT_1025538 [Pavlovales sp. CCMP2436]
MRRNYYFFVLFCKAIPPISVLTQNPLEFIVCAQIFFIFFFKQYLPSSFSHSAPP